MTKKSPDVADATSPQSDNAAGVEKAPVEAKGASKKSVAIGAAAVGIGSAAIVAALLYTRRR